MPGANELPYFIKVEFNEQGQFRRFTESVDSAALDAERSFQRSMDSIVRASQEGSRAAQGAFNLDFNVSGQRASAEAAELQAIKLRAAAQAAQELEREGAQLGRSTAVTVAGFQTAAREAEELAREERELADAMEQVQARAGAQIPSLRQLTAADQAAQRSVRSSRVAYIQAGQQLTDMSVQMQSGTRATTIFAQQVPQLAFALSYLEKSTDPAQAKLGRFARFLSGPWGAAIFIGTSLLGGLIEKLLEAAPALEAAEAGSDGLASAQSALGQIFDLTSGRIESQNELLRLNARLMAVTLRAEAAQEQIASRQYLGGGRNQSFLGTAASFFNRGGGGNPFERARTPPLARGVIDRLESGEITAEQALTEIGALPSNAFQGTGASQAEVLQGIVNRISAPLKEQTADAIDRSLSSGTLDPSFLRNDRTGGGSDRSGSSAASRLSEFGDDAADRIARLNDQFSNTPGLVARANQAMRQLDDLLEDIRERRPPDFETLITQAEALRPIIEDSINQPYRDLIESQATQRRIGAEILSQGEEAGALLRVRIQLEEQMGRELLPAELAAIEDNLAAEREQNQLLEERARLIDGQIKQLTGVRSILVDIAANPADIGNSIGNLISQFQGFSAETLIESMFGSTFRDLEERFRQRTPLEIANDNAAEAIDDTTVSVNDFRSAIEGATSALGSGSGSVPGVSGLSKSLGKIVDGTKQAAEVLEAPGVPISVTGQRPPASATAAGYPSPRELYNEIGRSIGEELGPLGREIGSQLGNALQGAGYGTLAGGLVLGQSGSSTGSGIGGALGGVFG